MTEIINNQRKIKIDAKIYREFVGDAIRQVHEIKDKTVTIAFISDRRMSELNSEFRGKNATTDVLSFPFEASDFEDCENTLGDIVISLEQAQKQAAENGLNLETEVKQLILHGILHLCGYDHETDNGEMNKREIQLRKTLKINQ